MPSVEKAILNPFEAMDPASAALVAVCGLVVVFLMLAILALVIKINSKLVSVLEGRNETPAPAPAAAPAKAAEEGQVSLLDMGAAKAADRLRQVDVNVLTPIEAMNLVYELKQML